VIRSAVPSGRWDRSVGRGPTGPDWQESVWRVTRTAENTTLTTISPPIGI